MEEASQPAPCAPSLDHAAPAQPSSREVVVVLVGLLLAAHELSRVLTPIMLSAALAYGVSPLVRIGMARFGLPRTAAVILVFLVTVLALSLGGWWISTAMAQAVMAVGRDLPALLDRLVRESLGQSLTIFGATYDTSVIPNKIMQEVMSVLGQPGFLLIGAEGLVGLPTTLVLMVVTLFYFIRSGPTLGTGLLRLTPPRYREHLMDLARRIDPVLRKYLRGVAAVVIYTSVVAYLALAFLIHLPFAAMISVLVGGLEIIPVVGPAASMVLISASALLSGHGISAVVWALGFAVLLRISIDEVVGPVVLGRFVALHPVAVILAFLIAGGLFGLLGVLLAVPACAAGKIILQVWYGEAQAR